MVLLGIQLALGIGSFVARFTPIWIPGEQLTMLALPVAHRLVGSLILGALLVAAVRVLDSSVMPRAARSATADGLGAHLQPVSDDGALVGHRIRGRGASASSGP